MAELTKPKFTHFSRTNLFEALGGRRTLNAAFKIVDARKPYRLRVLREDCQGAEPCSPINCGLARVSWRKGLPMWITRTTAYVATTRDTVLKYVVPGAGRAHILNNDMTGLAQPNVTVRLLPPPPSMRMNARAGEKARRGVRRKRTPEAIAQGVETRRALRQWERLGAPTE